MSAVTRPAPRKLGAQWLPRQHGAWAMLFLPYLVGVIFRVQAGEVPSYLWPLLPTWLFGYFAFNALSLWLKTGRKPLYVAPLLTYGGVTAALGALTAYLAPSLLSWALAFAPLLGIGLWRASQRDDASLLARGSAVVAACLICAVAAVGGLGEWVAQPLTSRVTLATLTLWGYFLGTLFYVKTMIREKGEASYYRLSVTFHAAVLLIALWAAASHGLNPWIPAFFVLTTVRAALMPQLERWRARRITPKQVGLTEFAISFFLLFVLCWS